jgi:hypothetical protein
VIGRVFRMVRTPITLLVLLGVLCYGAWWGYTNVIKPAPPIPPTPCVNQRVSQGELKSSQVVVNVYNGGTKKGLAGDVGRSLRSRGFRVTKTSNTGQKITKTVILGAGAKNPEVLLVKGFFKDAQVKVDKRPDHTVDVLVGNDYGGFNKKAKDSLRVKTRTVCLPPQSSTTAKTVDS